MVRPTDFGSSACAPTNVATRARRPPLTVVDIPPDATITTVTAIITEATHTNLREVTRATTDKVTTTTARPPTPALTRLSSSDKMPETPETCRSLSLYSSLIMERLRPPPRPLEPLAVATALRTMPTITQLPAGRERFVQVVADRPMAVRPPSKFRL